jgi:hypothetical protein
MANGGVLPGADLNGIFGQFRQTMEHVGTYTELDRMFDWQLGEYAVEIRVNTANPDRTFKQCLRFAVTDQDIATLRLNCFKIIEEACGIQSMSTYNFGYCNYLSAGQAI